MTVSPLDNDYLTGSKEFSQIISGRTEARLLEKAVTAATVAQLAGRAVGDVQLDRLLLFAVHGRSDGDSSCMLAAERTLEGS